MLRLVVVRTNIKAEEVGADGGDIDLHDSKSFVESLDVGPKFVPQLLDFRTEFVAQASYFRSQLLPQLGSHPMHLVAKAMDVVAEA